MNPLQLRLIGELVGLARATDGNEHLISEESTAVIAACLASNPADEEEFQALRKRILNAKRNMVPDCFLCANPCGRTDAYDISLLEQEKSDIRDAKYEIIRKLQLLCERGSVSSCEERLYLGLIVIGLDGYGADELGSIFAG